MATLLVRAETAEQDLGDGLRDPGVPIRKPPSAPRSGGSVALLCVLLLALALAGCSSTGPAPVDGWGWKGPVPKGYYLVRKGDTLGGIAAKRRISTRNLIRWNGLKSPYKIYAGRLLRVTSPGGRTVAVAPARPPGAAQTGPSVKRARPVSAPAAPAVPGSRAAVSRVAWLWPLDGPVLQGFRAGDRTRQGIRIGCRAGDAVRTAGAGQVVYSGSGLKGYGNLIIVKHNKSYLSAYGFNRRLLVKEGDKVERGQVVAECGQGPEGAYLLHFEVRREGASVNPILYLPPRK